MSAHLKRSFAKPIIVCGVLINKEKEMEICYILKWVSKQKCKAYLKMTAERGVFATLTPPQTHANSTRSHSNAPTSAPALTLVRDNDY